MQIFKKEIYIIVANYLIFWYNDKQLFKKYQLNENKFEYKYMKGEIENGKINLFQ